MPRGCIGVVVRGAQSAPCKLAPARSAPETRPSGERTVLQPIHLFELAAQQSRYLSTNQSVIAENVANANTPGFRARAMQPFSDVLDHTQLTLAATNPSHIGLTPADAQAAAVTEDEPWEVTESGNSVSLEQEMIKAGDVNRSFSLNTSLVKAFHSMLIASVR